MTETYIIKLVHRHAGRRNDTVLDTFVPGEAGGWTPLPRLHPDPWPHGYRPHSRHEIALEGGSVATRRYLVGEAIEQGTEVRAVDSRTARNEREVARRRAQEDPEYRALLAEDPWEAHKVARRVAWQINRRCPGCGEVLSYSFREGTLYRAFDGYREKGWHKVGIEELARMLNH